MVLVRKTRGYSAAALVVCDLKVSLMPDPRKRLEVVCSRATQFMAVKTWEGGPSFQRRKHDTDSLLQPSQSTIGIAVAVVVVSNDSSLPLLRPRTSHRVYGKNICARDCGSNSESGSSFLEIQMAARWGVRCSYANLEKTAYCLPQQVMS